MSTKPEPEVMDNDHKFELPKPDFQFATRKRPAWPIAVVALLVALGAIGKVFYHFYFLSKQPDFKESIQTTAIKTIHSNQNQTHTEPLPPSTPTDTSETKGIGNNPITPIHHTQEDKDLITDTIENQEEDIENEIFEKQKKVKKRENIQAVQARLEAEKRNPKPLVSPGTYQTLSSPQGVYHLVVYSHLDKRIAMKKVQQLMRQNLGVYLILPRKKEKYYRVTIAHSRTRYEADERLKKIKPRYPNSFILHY